MFLAFRKLKKKKLSLLKMFNYLKMILIIIHTFIIFKSNKTTRYFIRRDFNLSKININFSPFLKEKPIFCK